MPQDHAEPLLTRLASLAAFDPAPHIRTLEGALAQLLPLRKANAQKTSELERQVAVAERTYRGDVRGAKAGFEVRLRPRPPGSTLSLEEREGRPCMP